METTATKSAEFLKICEEYGINPDNVPEIMSFEAACKATGRSEKLPDVPEEDLKVPVQSLYKMLIITEALNEKHKFDYNNSNDKKWYCWFDLEVSEYNPSGFRFFDSTYLWADANSGVGARLSFKNEAIAIFAGRFFSELFKACMTQL